MSDSARGNSKSIRREVLISCLMRTLSPIGKFRLRMDEETLSPSCKALFFHIFLYKKGLKNIKK